MSIKLFSTTDRKHHQKYDVLLHLGFVFEDGNLEFKKGDIVYSLDEVDSMDYDHLIDILYFAS